MDREWRKLINKTVYTLSVNSMEAKFTFVENRL